MVTQEVHTVPELNVISSFDLLIAEVIRETKPHWVIEIGNRSPISILYHGYLLSLLGEEAHTLVSITPDLSGMPRRRNIYYLEEGAGSELSARLRRLISPEERVMAVIRTGGGDRNPLTMIQRYAPLVTEGSHLILSGEVADFALKNVVFEPDWTVQRFQVYLSEGKPARRRRPALLKANADQPVSAALRC